ncbi:hypothetical protein G9F32_06395 [Acinetobacter sp. 194]|uniref:hypothetical protein n=1 Tax=Acinetobacter shaoyimingii TaxID=2715164 RepID=UPI00140D31C0|nr:hypothetical protein [Acinetobacter shaoyimingii]NHB57663.1 hypothetical protein [Acinetobacter shaoyimingii]
MFSLLKLFKSIKKSEEKKLEGIAEHPFYNQRLCLDGSLLVVIQHQDDQEVIDLKDIQWITIIHHGESLSGYPNCWLLFRYGNKQKSICTVAAHYDEFESYILNLDNFDRNLYWEIKDKKVIENEILLYQASQENNYELIPQYSSILPLEQGICLENMDTILPWVDYAQLDIQNMITIDMQAPNPDYESKQFLIKDVQIFNGLRLANIYTETSYSNSLNLNFPIIRYESDIKTNDVKATFFELAQHFDRCFETKGNNIEQNDRSLDYVYQQGNCSLKLKCKWNDRLKSYDSQLYLEIEKEPNLDRFYVNDILNNLELNELKTCLLETGYDDRTTYLDVENKFYTPAHFNIKDEQTLIWRSDEKQILGISNSEFTRMFKSKEVSEIILSIANCRGGEGRNFLKILNGFRTLSEGISVDETKKWILLKDDIFKTLNVSFNVEYFEEHY